MRNKKRFEAAISGAFPDAGVSWGGDNFDEPRVVAFGHSVFFDPEHLVPDFIMLIQSEMLMIEIWGGDSEPQIKIIELKKPKRGHYEIIKTRGRPFNDEQMDYAIRVMMDKVIAFLAARHGYRNLDS